MLMLICNLLQQSLCRGSVACLAGRTHQPIHRRLVRWINPECFPGLLNHASCLSAHVIDLGEQIMWGKKIRFEPYSSLSGPHGLCELGRAGRDASFNEDARKQEIELRILGMVPKRGACRCQRLTWMIALILHEAYAVGPRAVGRIKLLCMTEVCLGRVILGYGAVEQASCEI